MKTKEIACILKEGGERKKGKF